MKRLLYIGILVLLSLPLAAQKEKLTIHLHEVLFSEFADSLEKRVPYKVYYSDDWVDSLYVSVDAEQEAIRDLVRTRDDFKTSQRQVRQQLLAFTVASFATLDRR